MKYLFALYLSFIKKCYKPSLSELMTEQIKSKIWQQFQLTN